MGKRYFARFESKMSFVGIFYTKTAPLIHPGSARQGYFLSNRKFIGAQIFGSMPEKLSQKWPLVFLDTPRPWKNGRQFTEGIFKWIFLKLVYSCANSNFTEFVPHGPVHDRPILFRLVTLPRLGDRLQDIAWANDYHVQWLICIIRSRCVYSLAVYKYGNLPYSAFQTHFVEATGLNFTTFHGNISVNLLGMPASIYEPIWLQRYLAFSGLKQWCRFQILTYWVIGL